MDIPIEHERPLYQEEIIVKNESEAHKITNHRFFHDEIKRSFNKYELSPRHQAVFTVQKQIEVVLYIRPSCPFCIRVINYLSSIGLSIPIKDVGRDQEAYQELLTMGQKTQVPCLFIDGVAFYESSWIIQWLDENKNNVKMLGKNPLEQNSIHPVESPF